MGWKVNIAAKTEKRVMRLPLQVQKALALLIADIEAGGPVRGDWPNYSRLPGNRHHCHLKKGKPTYVAVWEDVAGQIKVIEVVYAGTHEKAPYRRRGALFYWPGVQAPGSGGLPAGAWL